MDTLNKTLHKFNIVCFAKFEGNIAKTQLQIDYFKILSAEKNMTYIVVLHTIDVRFVYLKSNISRTL